MLIRHEAVNDYDVIAAINRAAFPGEDEARLVDLIRRDGPTVASLVAVDGSDVVGHVLGIELVPASLSGIGTGRVVYPDVFNQL